MAVLTTNDSCVEFKQESTPISILDDDCELLCMYSAVCVVYNNYSQSIIKLLLFLSTAIMIEMALLYTYTCLSIIMLLMDLQL